MYRLLALTNSSIIPEYAKSVKDVFIEWFLKMSDKLVGPQLILPTGIGTAFTNPHGLPSWLPDLAMSSDTY